MKRAVVMIVVSATAILAAGNSEADVAEPYITSSPEGSIYVFYNDEASAPNYGAEYRYFKTTSQVVFLNYETIGTNTYTWNTNNASPVLWDADMGMSYMFVDFVSMATAEAATGCSKIADQIRIFWDENGAPPSAISDLDISPGDLDGMYFVDGSYSISGVIDGDTYTITAVGATGSDVAGETFIHTVVNNEITWSGTLFSLEGHLHYSSADRLSASMATAEAASGCGKIADQIRIYWEVYGVLPITISDLDISASELDGAYFNEASYVIAAVSGKNTYTIIATCEPGTDVEGETFVQTVVSGEIEWSGSLLDQSTATGRAVSYDASWDLDFDGVPDGQELESGSIPDIPHMIDLSSDMDGDGLTLAQEGQYGTNPNSYDSYNFLIGIVGEGSVSPPNGSYSIGTDLTLIATPDEGSFFLGWSGDLVSTNPVENITLSKAMFITATFDKPPPAPPVVEIDSFYESMTGTAVLIDTTPVDGYPTDFTYQWYFGAFPIPHATNASYSIPGSPTYNGSWSVDVANSAGLTNVSFVYAVYVDTDGDGLSDGSETYVHLTDPNDTDSDDDGLGDGDELNTYLTDPLDADSDDDGLNDGAEINVHELDPLDPDSDDDGLSDGDEVNTYNTDPLNTDSDSDGLDDGDEVTIYNTNPAAHDSDSDGLGDGAELNIYGTDPNDADSDGDGFMDGYEISTGYNPADGTDSPDLVLEIQTAIEIKFGASQGSIYHIEGTDDLGNSWQPVETNILGNGEIIRRLYSVETQSNRFFRVIKN